MKKVIFAGIFIFGAVGSGLGNMMDHQSPFNFFYLGGWTILMSTIGSFFGVWVGFKVGQYFDL